MASVSKQSNLSLAEPAERRNLRENPIMLVSLQGQSLGKYRVLEPLGRGGMAQVYRAYHPQLDRYVAVKVLRSDLIEEEEFLNRFRREAQSVANLRHPNIVQIHDFDIQENIYYMIMELLEGDTLKAQLSQRRGGKDQLPWGDIMRIMLDVLQGLEYAHAEGIIHRDIKPANIMLTRRGQAVVTDFGIAQIIGSTQFTVSGALMGTLSYMAPEQGLEGRTSVQSDLYSLGIVFYEMLTGRPPFDADTPLAILMKHVNDPLPLPRTINPNIPEPFERVVFNALSKQSEERYQSAALMATAIKDAVKEIGVDLPEHISLPGTTPARKSAQEAVAVFSGSERDQITDAPFVSDDTEINLVDQEAKSSTLEDASVKAEMSPSTPKREGKRSAFEALLPAGLALIGFNLMAVFLGIVSGNWRIFGVGWPAEVILISLGLCLLMVHTGIPALLIPVGILMGNGFLLAFYSLTGFWNFWKFLWPLEPLLVIVVVVYFLMVRTRQEDRHQLTIQIGKRLTQLAFVVLVITVAIAAIPIG
jgi:serine/threonine protein kinase